MFLKGFFKAHKFLMGVLLLLVILSVEVYFVDIVPFINGEWLLVGYLALSLLFLLFYVGLLVVGLPWALLNRRKVAAAGLPKGYGLWFVWGLFTWLSVLLLVAFQPFYKVVVVNDTEGDIGNVVCSASFGSGVARVPLETMGRHQLKVFAVKGLGAFGNFILDDKAVVKFLQHGKQKWVSSESMFLRTEVVVRDYSASNPKAMDCGQDVYDYYSGAGMTMGINLCSEWMEMDTIALSYISNSPVGYVVVNTPYENRIKRVERVLHWYPSVWSDMDDDLLQYTKLTGMRYETTDEMKVLSVDEERFVTSPDVMYGNVIGYVSPNRADYDLSVYGDVSKDEVVEQLMVELKKPKSGYQPLTDAEIGQWMGYMDEYAMGKFLNDEGSRFSVDYFDIYLRVTFEGDDGDFVKVLHSWVHVGN